MSPSERPLVVERLDARVRVGLPRLRGHQKLLRPRGSEHCFTQIGRIGYEGGVVARCGNRLTDPLQIRTLNVEEIDKRLVRDHSIFAGATAFPSCLPRWLSVRRVDQLAPRLGSVSSKHVGDYVANRLRWAVRWGWCVILNPQVEAVPFGSVKTDFARFQNGFFV